MTVKRTTKQKTIVLEQIISYVDKHFSAEQLMEDIKRKGEVVAKATIYRILKQLVEEGVLRKYFLNENTGACYQFIEQDKDCANHYHLVCNMCNNVTHFNSDLIEKFSQVALKDNGFKIDGRKTVFYGECLSCQTIGGN